MDDWVPTTCAKGKKTVGFNAYEQSVGRSDVSFGPSILSEFRLKRQLRCEEEE